MAQTKNARRVEATEARAKLVNVRISPQKLNLVAASIRGLPVQKALNELEFSHKRIAGDVRKVLYSAISNISCAACSGGNWRCSGCLSF